MNIETVEALKLAIESEKRSLMKYLEFAIRNEDIRGKNIFIMLARDEFNHYEHLNQLFKIFVTNDDHSLITTLPSSEVEKLVPTLKKYESSKKVSLSLKEEQVINIALNLEDEAKTFYLEQYRKAKNSHTKDIWKGLADIEESHYQLLISQTFYLKELAYWHNIKEFSLEISED
ncbi:MAG: hypothetical protein DDT42_00361 [candidate division WS2 bacterium]|uniref:Rubrerythrin diiron-binding domain-containing protein n=1 Tax=Psychracetigena formicireducens TaxID=2986056 RepID=A0A9E2BI15_PSYF1|nr:hypothetical protein [Candidatus Psychracetigena formicireducens]MBT9144520.1 hypothetical protein [Candidatus Psychracetigena formicireducens]